MYSSAYGAEFGTRLHAMCLCPFLFFPHFLQRAGRAGVLRRRGGRRQLRRKGARPRDRAASDRSLQARHRSLPTMNKACTTMDLCCVLFYAIFCCVNRTTCRNPVCSMCASQCDRSAGLRTLLHHTCAKHYHVMGDIIHVSLVFQGAAAGIDSTVVAPFHRPFMSDVPTRVLLGAPETLRGVLQHLAESYPGSPSTGPNTGANTTGSGAGLRANPDWLLAELVRPSSLHLSIPAFFRMKRGPSYNCIVERRLCGPVGECPSKSFVMWPCLTP